MISEAQSDEYWKELMLQILRTYARTSGELDSRSSEEALWKAAVRVLGDYAKEHGIVPKRYHTMHLRPHNVCSIF